MPPTLLHHRRAQLVSRIVELQQALAQAERALNCDDLTELLNRRGFRRACDAPADSMPAVLSCVMIDLDGFKAINDNLGHCAGDAVLTRFAGALKRRLRPRDIVARLGGDEFALLLADAKSQEAEHILKRIQRDLQHNLDTALAGPLQFSAGIAAKKPDEFLAQALARADAALLRAKKQGKNRIVRATAPTPCRNDAG
ncbi:MAG: GGDEF domain-containing protein [Desulfovibrionaceae bacterium]|nr:GGDEF domain-containing protein [Desulfovibrionaceae bacterium]